MKYSPKMSLSGPSKPLFTWTQLMKQAEDNAKTPKMFPSKVKSFGYDKATVARIHREKEKQKKFEQETALQKARRDAEKKSVSDKIEGVASNAVNDARSIVSGLVHLATNAVGEAWNNGTDVKKDFIGIKDFGQQVAKSTYDSYDELGAVSHWGAALDKTYQAAKSGDVGGTLGGVGAVVRSLNPIEQVYNTVTDSNFDKFGNQVADHPLFYALDVVPGGRALHLGEGVGKVVTKLPKGTEAVDFLKSRGQVVSFTKKHYADRFNEGALAKEAERGSGKLDAIQRTIQTQLHTGMNFDREASIRGKAVVRDAGMPDGIGKVHTDEALNELLATHPEVVDLYKKAEPYAVDMQKLQKAYDEKLITKAEYDLERGKVLSRVEDKYIKQIVDSFDRTNRAATKNAFHLGLTQMQTMIHAMRPQMSLKGYKLIEDITKNFEHFITVKSGRAPLAVARKISRDVWEIDYINHKGVRISRREVTRDWVKKNLIKREDATAKFYESMLRNLQFGEGSKLAPTYIHHSMSSPLSTSTLMDTVTAPSRASKRSNLVAFDTGRLDRIGSVEATMHVFDQGVRGYIAARVLQDFVRVGREGEIPARIKVLTSPREVQQLKSDKNWSVLSNKDDAFSKVKEILLSEKHNIDEFNRIFDTHMPNPGKDVMALAIHNQTLKYVRSMLGYQKDVNSLVRVATNSWKISVLSFRPAFVVANVIGNTTMAMMRDPRIIREQLLLSIQKAKGGKTIARDLRYDEAMIQRDFLETTSGFGRNERVGVKYNIKSLNRAEYDALPRAKKALGEMERLINLSFDVVRIHEDLLRGSMTRSALKHDAEIRRYMKADRTPNTIEQGKLTRAWEKLKVEQPDYAKKLQREVTTRVESTMGNYHYFSPREQFIKQVFPFYSWYRHISKYALDDIKTGYKSIGYAAVGRLHEEYPEFSSFPEFASNFLPFDKDLMFNDVPDGRTRALDLSSINPFATIPEVLDASLSLVTMGKHGDASSLLSMVNPVITAPIEVMSGKNLRTGGTIDRGSGLGGVLGATGRRLFTTNPVVETFVNRGLLHAYDLKVDPNDPTTYLTPTGRESTAGVAPSAYGKSFASAFYRWFGIPIQDVDPEKMRELRKKMDAQRDWHYFKLPSPPKPKDASKAKTRRDWYNEQNGGTSG